MAFCNSTINAPYADRPHICVRKGLYRVSSYKKPYTEKRARLWNDAHAYARKMNELRGSPY